MNVDSWDAARSTTSDHHLDYAYAQQHRAWSAAPSHSDVRPRQYASAVVTADLPTFRPRMRHSPAVDERLATASPRPMPSGPWRLRHDDHSNAPPALQVHIPHSSNQDLARVALTPTAQESQPFAHHEPQSAHCMSAGASTSLPSFASFQEHTARNEDGDLIIAPMSQRLSCNMCTKLKPLVRDIAVAVGEIDENVQSLCTKPINRPSEFPSDSAIRTANWILERLRFAKGDLQDAGRRSQAGFLPASSTGISGFAMHSSSPANHLKRNADQWEREDLPKRPRSGASSDQPQSVITPRDERRPSIDFASRDLYQRSAYSPPPESVSGSTHQKQGSPVMSSRGLRALPSPSSMAYAPSAAPSLPPMTAQSVGSPAASYQQTSNLQNVQANNATNAHIADLQHQVTLKTLAFQSLHTEYGTLLAKLQREKQKSQTIEKKTSVADQEVNDLTGKNEDLTEQVRALEQQLEESEKKRELDRIEATKEKDQWGRMLEMGGRLHAKGLEDQQKLIEEKSRLLERIERLENQESVQQSGLERFDRQSESSLGKSLTFARLPDEINGENGHGGLRGENIFLKRRIDSLLSALSDARRHSRDLEEKAGAFAKQTGLITASIASVLQDDESRTKARALEPAYADQPPAHQRQASMLPPRSSRGSTTPSTNTPNLREFSSVSASTLGTTAFSPSFADHGCDAATSSGDIIRSLGSLPAPPPKTSLDSTRHRDADVTARDTRYRSEQPCGQGEPVAWTSTDHSHYWNSSDRMIQLRHDGSSFRTSPAFENRAGISPYSSPPSDAADDLSSNSSGPGRYNHDNDSNPSTTSYQTTRQDGFQANLAGYPRDTSYMLPPPRPA